MPATPATARYRDLDLLPAFLALLVGVLGHLPVLGAYWNQDDWGLLARVAGLIPSPGLQARMVSQVVYWDLMYPLWGLVTDPYTWSRLLLHGGSAFLVARIGAKGGMNPRGQLIAGLLFAATPVVFTPLYWASGIQELLGTFFVLAAVERWLTGGRRNQILTLLFGTISFLSKESGLGLPLFLAILFYRTQGSDPVSPDRGGRFGWMVIALLAALSVGEALLVWNHFDHGPGRPYSLDWWLSPWANLAGLGWWLITPGPVASHQVGLVGGLAGGSLWVLWLLASLVAFRRGNRWLAACLFGALLSLLPVLPLQAHQNPYFLYTCMAAVSLALGSLIPSRWQPRQLVLVIIVLTAATWAWAGTNLRLKMRDEEGLPANSLVLRTAISYEAMQTLRATTENLNPAQSSGLILLQVQPPGSYTEMAESLGENWVTASVLYTAVGGHSGPRLVLGDSVSVHWSNGLSEAAPDAFILVEDRYLLRTWGQLPQALMYLSLTEVAFHQFTRAGQHLLRAALLSGQTIPLYYDADLMLVTNSTIQWNAPAFREYLQLEPDKHRQQALLSIFDELLDICCGSETPASSGDRSQ